MSTPARHQVRQSFERAAATYDQAAGVQRLACKILAEQLPQSLSATPRLLDAGCGTGYALPLLQAFAPTAEVLALDLAPAMLARAHAATARIQGDLECLPLATACIDLYWSSLAWQWCDPARALAEARRVLRPGGYFLLCSLGPATFTNYARPLQRSMTTRTPSIFLLATRCCSSRKAQDFRRWRYAASALPCTIQTSDICCRR